MINDWKLCLVVRTCHKFTAISRCALARPCSLLRPDSDANTFFFCNNSILIRAREWNERKNWILEGFPRNAVLFFLFLFACLQTSMVMECLAVVGCALHRQPQPKCIIYWESIRSPDKYLYLNITWNRNEINRQREWEWTQRRLQLREWLRLSVLSSNKSP